MFISSLLALIQMGLLPGLLLAYGFRLYSSRSQLLLHSFLLSALLNFLLIQIYIPVGIYTATTVYTVMAAELLWLTILLYRRGVFTAPPCVDTNHGRSMGNRLAISRTDWSLWSLSKNPRVLFEALALALVIFAAVEALLRIGDIFTVADALNSWNRWAIEIAENTWPKNTLGYPQLIPSNYSLAYLFSGNTDIWFFPKAWISWFFLALLLSMFQLYRDDGRWEIALAVALCFWIFYQLMHSRFVYGGAVDIALATFAFNAIAAILRAAKATETPTIKRELVLGALFAIGCALTKQGGLYLLLSFPVVAWLCAIKDRRPEQHAAVLRFLLHILLPVMLLAVSSWYLPDILRGYGDHGMITSRLVMKLHEGRDLGERLIHAMALLEKRTSPWAVAVVGLLLASSLTVPRFRVIALVVTLPYVLLWALGFSYDHRNIALALPFIALGSAIGAGVVWNWLKLPTVNSGLVSAIQFRWIMAIAILATALALLNDHYSTKRLSQQHKHLLVTTVPVRDLNIALVNYFRENPGSGRILTRYYTMRWMPGLKDRYIHIRELLEQHQLTGSNRPASKLDKYLAAFNATEVEYVLFNSRIKRPVIARYLQAGTQTGEFEQLFTVHNQYIFYRKLTPPQQATLNLSREILRESRRSTQPQ